MLRFTFYFVTNCITPITHWSLATDSILQYIFISYSHPPFNICHFFSISNLYCSLKNHNCPSDFISTDSILNTTFLSTPMNNWSPGLAAFIHWWQLRSSTSVAQTDSRLLFCATCRDRINSEFIKNYLQSHLSATPRNKSLRIYSHFSPFINSSPEWFTTETSVRRESHLHVYL